MQYSRFVKSATLARNSAVQRGAGAGEIKEFLSS
jgi:hypothetical protein